MDNFFSKQKQKKIEHNFQNYYKRGPVQQSIQSFFLTKSQAKKLQEEEDKKRKTQEEYEESIKSLKIPKLAYYDFSEWDKRQKWEKTKQEAKAKREAEMLTEVYKCLRYWVSLDGSVQNYIRNYCNPDMRFHRIIFLEKEHIYHDEKLQEHINETIGTQLK